MKLSFSAPRLRKVVTAAALSTLLLPASASADLFRIGSSLSTLLPGGVWRGVDTAYDSNNGIYLVVTASEPGVVGAWTNAAGTPLASFAIHTGTYGHFPRARFNPETGQFMVVWQDLTNNTIKSRLVSFTVPGYLVNGTTMISDPGQGLVFTEYRPAVAYSTTSHRYLVAWPTTTFGIQGRFVSASGNPEGGIFRFEDGGSRDPSLTWNPSTDEFGLANSGWVGGAHAAFRRIRASDGAVSAPQRFGYSVGTYATGVDVTASNQYVVTWGIHPGTRSALLDASGNVLSGGNFVSDRFGGDNSQGLAFNGSGSGLVVGSDHNGGTYEVIGVQLNASALPVSSNTVLTEGGRPSYYPLVAGRTGSSEWNVVRSLNYLGANNQIISTSGITQPPPSGGGGTPTPTTPTGCSTSDPFAAIGGGICVNGGWVPKGTSAPTTPPPTTTPTTPPPTSTGCSTPDPFVAIGGGTCVNGGWIPGGGGSTTTPPPTTPTTPPPSNTGCSTADPFAAIGGGTCINGGWVPGKIGGGSSSGGGCSTPDPFVGLGGGTCVNGGWIPGRSSSCSTPDPFTSLGGGVCINGGWIPR